MAVFARTITSFDDDGVREPIAFHSNIRQNTELPALADDSEIIPVRWPRDLAPDVLDHVSIWLRVACLSKNGSAQLAKNFCDLELSEKSRLQKSLQSGVNVTSTRSSDQLSPYDVSASIEQGERNRYANIFPYEHSRVRLKLSPASYMNANYVQFNESTPKYIVTQAPTPVTFVDFWQMVWDCKVRVIYMLTPLTEGMTSKAHDYWKEIRYGKFQITKHSKVEHNLENLVPFESCDSKHSVAIITELTLTDVDAPFEALRQITHVHALDWHDMTTIENPILLPQLINLPEIVRIRKEYVSTEPTDVPVLVHCSAGCGRSGVFIAVDTALSLFNTDPSCRGSKDMLFEIIKAFRLQRMSLVQTMRQYTLCYEALFAECIYKLRLDPAYFSSAE